MKSRIKSWIRIKSEAVGNKLEKNILSNKSLKSKVVFGPVQSRRLGNVLGINNIKLKACSYDCIYCPSGSTSYCSIFPKIQVSPFSLYLSVKTKLKELQDAGKKIDYIVFDGSGEPTLDSSLSQEIKLLREFGYKIAVITNASMLWNNDIRENLMFADYVSIKIDTANEETWLKINRPHRRLDFSQILKGIKQFSEKFQGILTTETTLIKNMNDSPEEVGQLSGLLNNIKRDASYFMTPKYLPLKEYAVSPDKYRLQQICEIIKGTITNSIMLDCPENEEFFATSDFENELLGLLSIHPVRVDSVQIFFNKNGGTGTLKNLIETNTIKEISYDGKIYYKENYRNELSTAC